MRNLAAAVTLALCFFGRGVLRADPQVIGGVDTSRWHGFNLLEKFTLRGNAPYREDDFRWIAELGFNFVRLPMDYRCYTEAGDWLKFREPALAEIDQAIAFGEKYHVHVCLNLHRAPGYCINPPAEPKDLWTDPAAEEAFVAHWAMFARRYRDVPPERLSFNLLNEPLRNTRESYLRVHRRAIAAIHAIDPRRLVVVDGNNAGRDPAPELLAEPNVIQATRGYHPAAISHFQASWVRGSDTWPVPTWPLTRLAGHLYGPTKPELKTPLGLRGNFAAGTEFTLRIRLLSGRATLQASADGQIVARADFDPKANPTAWRDAPQPPWVFHEPAGEMSFVVRLPAPAKEVVIENTNGDWIQFQPLTCRLPGEAPRVWPADATWGTRQITHEVDAHGDLLPPRGVVPAQPLIDYLRPWRDVAAQGATVFVGEWGCFNHTPHPVALAWMRSWLEQWQQARFGWALWNFRGGFGILDSNRTDVTYEDWHGHKLDRDMVRLLQRFNLPSPEAAR
jgi:aryl-phospho-beta-D-glucosidase BglC (GH1 family)